MMWSEAYVRAWGHDGSSTLRKSQKHRRDDHTDACMLRGLHRSASLWPSGV